MTKAFGTVLLLIILTQVAYSQTIKGKITNQSGEPIPYATVYISEIRQGSTSNTRGAYEIKLSPGKYTVIYQSLGYEPVTTNITVSDKTIIRDVVLPLQYYQIPEVRITATGEDPAYPIMRKAISLAPYYLNNISYYKASVYLKGNLVINRIPKLIKRSMQIEARKESQSSGNSVTIKEGETYLMESFNEIEFTAPDKYSQRVLSYKSTFPEEGNEISPMEYISASFYQPVIADMAISPLAPNAFSHYTFRYLGASVQGNYTINKIKVTPRRKSQQLFEGTIYIIEDLWCLQSIDLTNENLAGTVKVQQLYIPVKDDIWMPVSHKFEIAISIIGFKADAAYGGSIKYQEVRPNERLQKPGLISSSATTLPLTDIQIPDTVKSKSDKQIEKILQKEELTNRDMVRLSRLMEKESEKSTIDSAGNSLEIKEKTTHVIDDDAGRKDSIYWAEIRPVPLSEQEIRSIRVSDSIRTVNSLKVSVNDSVARQSGGKKSNAVNTLRNITFGHTWSDTTGFSFRYGGLIDLNNFSFNTVDGFIYGFDFRFSKVWDKKQSLTFIPEIRYAFSRQRIMWRMNVNYRFSGTSPGELFLRSGQTSKDIGTGGGINTLLNSVTTLFFERNYLKLYESRFITAGYRKEIANGLGIEFTSGYEERKVLENTTDFTIVNSSAEYTDNIPDNPYLAPGSDSSYALRDQDHISFGAKITYTPRQKYRVENGRKIPMGSDWPTFVISWTHGINDTGDRGSNSSHFDMLKGEIFKNHDIGAFSEMRWRVKAGGYLDNRNITFYDFFHFNPQPLPVLIDDYQDAFMLPSYYSMSTPEVFGEIHLKYSTPYLLLKLLPGLSNTLMRENLLFSCLASRFNPGYTEIGYSMSEIFFLAELGVYVGFEDLRYNSFGAKLILRFN